MSFPRDTLEAYQVLNLEDIPSDWVAEIWDNNLCEVLNTVEELSILSQSPDKWRDVVNVTRGWIGVNDLSTLSVTDNESNTVGFWTILFNAGVSHKTLLTVIYSLLEQNKPSILEKLCAIYCAQLYFLLLQVPGSRAYKTFHPMLFQKSLDILNLQPETGIVGVQRKRSLSTSSNTGRSKRSKRRELSIDEENDESLEETIDTGNLEIGLKQVMMDLLSGLRCFSLRDYEVTRQQVITSVLKMSAIGISTANKGIDFANTRITNSAQCPAHYLTWACLDALCTTHHGPLEQTLLEVFQCLLPVVTMVTGNVSSTSSIPNILTIPSQHAVSFVKHVVTRCGTVAIHPLKVLVQHICVRTPDKADFRTKMAGVVCDLLNLFDDEMYAHLIGWFYKLSKNTKVSCRVFAMDLVNDLITKPLRVPPVNSLSSELEYQLTYQYLLKMTLSRCSDISSSVRARALTCLATAAGCRDNNELVTVVCRFVFSHTEVDPLLVEPSPEGDPFESAVMSMLRRRTSDDKIPVRKAALQALEILAQLRSDGLHKEDILALHERCMDPALSVRKQAMISLTLLLLEHKESQHKELHSIWLDGVLPMVLDREIGAKDKCLSILEDVLLVGILKGQEDNQFVWRLLVLSTDNDKPDLRRCLHFVIQHWCENGKITAAIVKDIVDHTNIEEHKQAAWILLSEVSAFSNSITTKFILDNWRLYNTVTMATQHEHIVVSLMKMIGHSAKRLGHLATEDIKDVCLDLLSSFNLPISVVTAIINTLTMICSVLSQDNYQSVLVSWMSPLLKSCEQYLQTVLLRHSPNDDIILDEDKIISYLFILGEVAQLCPTHTSTHTGLLVQSLLLATNEGPDTDTDLVPLPSPSQLSHLQSLILSPSLRAHAYVTLGKLCLQDEDLAKTSLMFMTRDLEHSQHAAIRNNIVVVLCDLAVRYSAKIDPYIPNISMCLKDESLLVRRQTLTLLVNLLQEDYIKCKGSLFFRFVSILVDTELKSLTEFCLVHLLLVRNSTIFYHNFVECIFHFNDYKKHKVYNQFRQSDKERKLFSLAGTSHSDHRMDIYKFLLSHMKDEHRFQLTAKICQEILGGVVDQAIPLDEESIPVIRDSLTILSCKEIKHSIIRQQPQDDDGDPLDIAMATAQKKIISQMVKKNMIENIVPIIVSAKHLFEQERSPLLKDLLLCLMELMKDYKNEIKDILATDPQLAEEIQFDLRRFEEEQKRLQDQCRPTGTTATPLAQMASPLLSSSQQPLLTPVHCHPTGTKIMVLQSPKLKTNLQKKTPAKTPLVNVMTNQLMSTRGVNNKGTPVPVSKSNLIVAQKAPPILSDVTPLRVGNTTPLHPSSSPSQLSKTPLLKTPKINLMKVAVVSSAKKVVNKEPESIPVATSITQRAASTPQGITESISFNVSSMVPPSPIPPTCTVQCYMRTRSKTNDTPLPAADIVLSLPEDGPQELSKWNIK